MTWPFDPLQPLSYDFIMADPPWRFATWSAGGELKSPSAHYDCMNLGSIKELPVKRLAAQNCMLWLWTTNPMLPQAMEVLEAWGFTFKTAGHWVKRTKHGKLAFGTGYIFRNAGEPYLIGTIGSPKTTRGVRSVIEGPVREHSRKPDQAYAEAEKLIPDARRADLFARQRRPGWEGWGNELDKFEVAA